jgi:hypothetical protein
MILYVVQGRTGSGRRKAGEDSAYLVGQTPEERRRLREAVQRNQVISVRGLSNVESHLPDLRRLAQQLSETGREVWRTNRAGQATEIIRDSWGTPVRLVHPTVDDPSDSPIEQERPVGR